MEMNGADPWWQNSGEGSIIYIFIKLPRWFLHMLIKIHGPQKYKSVMSCFSTLDAGFVREFKKSESMGVGPNIVFVMFPKLF